MNLRVVALAGGTGSAKLIRGLAHILPTDQLKVVVNVGDNIKLHGLTICPDLDTIMYTLSGLVDRPRGWGVHRDTFRALRMLRRYGGEGWFKLGDADLATHLRRSQLLGEGLSLTQATQALCASLGVEVGVFPATDDWVETKIEVGGRLVHLQEFWVERRGRGKIGKIVFDGIEGSRVSGEVIRALDWAEGFILAPANPISSMMPMLKIPGMIEALAKARRRVRGVAVSPLVGGLPVSGPAKKMMEAWGVELSVYGVAGLYRGVIDSLVVDRRDEGAKARVAGLGVELVGGNIIMRGLRGERRLAELALRVLSGREGGG